MVTTARSGLPMSLTAFSCKVAVGQACTQAPHETHSLDRKSSPVWPALTTIHQPMAELARTATEILIAGGDITHRRLPHTLVERASVAPPYRKTA